MVGKTDLGGIFFKLGLDLDKNSFESGNKQINNASESMNKLIGTARNAAVALVSIKTIGKLGTLADAESSAYKTAEALGITTDSLNEWKAAAKIAGVDANSLVGSMGRLGYVLSHIEIDGSGLDEYSKKLQKLGMGITDLQDASGKWLSADSAFEKVIAKAQSDYAKASTDKEKLKIITIVGDILGNAGQDFFIALQNMGVSIADFKAGAGGTVWTNAQNNKDAMAFSKEWNTLQQNLSQIGALFGDNVAKELTQSVKDINEWLSVNGESIKQSLGTLAKHIGTGVGVGTASAGAASAIFKYMKAKPGSKEQQEAFTELQKAGSRMESNDILGPLYTFFMGQEEEKRRKEQAKIDRENIKGRLEGLKSRKEYTTKGKLDYNKVPGRIQSEMNQYIELGGSSSDFVNMPKIKDGIIKPNGQVTQVAPDDWVFAARNIGDLAKAFIPQSASAHAGNMEFSIVQNFTISGSSDLPQVLRHQAYQGTQDGLMQIMEQSSQRLQMMSGTR